MSDGEYKLLEMQPEDNELKNLLGSWKLLHLYDFFFDQKITTDKLLKLQPQHIKKLFRDIAVGDQVQFEDCLNKWRPKNFKNFHDENFSVMANQHNKVSLSEILNKCPSGSQLKKFYNLNGNFTEHHRGILISNIANYINVNGLPYTLTDCANIEREIVKMFPREKLESYTNGKRGRLYNKLSNLRRSIRELPVETPNTSKGSFCPESNAEQIVKRMRSEKISMDEFESLWRKCNQYRFEQIRKSNLTVEVLKNWPEYKLTSGYRFVNIDFELKYPKAESLLKDWIFKKEKIEKLLQCKITNSSVSNMLVRIKDYGDDSQSFALLWALHFTLPPSPTVVVGPCGGKMRKKFTITDSQNAFALIGASMAEIDTKLKLLQMKSVPIQPLLLIVGETTNVKEIFVFFDGIKYPFLNVLHAADICFKIFFIFDLKYPDEAKTFYKFIQAYFYNIESTKSPKVSSIISDLNAMK